MEGWDKDIFERVIKYATEFSQYFKEECVKFSVPFFNISSENFKEDINKVLGFVNDQIARLNKL
ncbi:MAG: hypothetical protein ABIA11_03960 [Patescibacteria group bacterium]|nr:hypothetical protein [Patescibacteria group bacterium]